MWILTLLRIPDVELIRIMGLDKFMVLKFLRMGIVVFTLYMLVAIPILIPVNVINQRNSAGLNVMTMGNIKDASRTWAHLVLSVLLTGKRILSIKIFYPDLICLFAFFSPLNPIDQRVSFFTRSTKPEDFSTFDGHFCFGRSMQTLSRLAHSTCLLFQNL